MNYLIQFQGLVHKKPENLLLWSIRNGPELHELGDVYRDNLVFCGQTASP